MPRMALLSSAQKNAVVEPNIDLFLMAASDGNQNIRLSGLYRCTHCVS